MIQKLLSCGSLIEFQILHAILKFQFKRTNVVFTKNQINGFTAIESEKATLIRYHTLNLGSYNIKLNKDSALERHQVVVA